MSITSGEPGIAETLSFTLWSLDSRVPDEAQKNTDHELTHRQPGWAGPARWDFSPITMRLSLFHLPGFLGSHSHLHMHSVQFPSPLTCNRIQHPGILPLLLGTAAQLAKCIGSETEKSKKQFVASQQAASILPFCFGRRRITGGFSFLGEAHRVLSMISPQKETREPVKLRPDQDFYLAWRQREWKKA